MPCGQSYAVSLAALQSTTHGWPEDVLLSMQCLVYNCTSLIALHTARGLPALHSLTHTLLLADAHLTHRLMAQLGVEFGVRKWVSNGCLCARHYHLCHALSTERWVPDTTEAVVIPRNITIKPPQVPPTSRCKTPQTPMLWDILRRDWRK
ncbi:hypothetical protein E2C01_013657 [Portunus trituberculatus]|uniref:Uncharacterized protein n=1 Tax=Portunus trituberculatus TaxID=210409 RepID=A0A5B7DGU8_PORTR|nr:hypothetical protein [Portunus trituberculatus]